MKTYLSRDSRHIQVLPLIVLDVEISPLLESFFICLFDYVENKKVFCMVDLFSALLFRHVLRNIYL